MRLSNFTDFQVIRYIIIGALSNLFGFLVYLAITSNGLYSIYSMTIVYVAATLVSFVGNKQWTFASNGRSNKCFQKYVVVQTSGYLTNFLLLSILCGKFGFPHQKIQFLAMLIVASQLYLLRKYYVFNSVASPF